MDAPYWLLDHAEITHSQYGEDGIISKILSMLPECDKHCVEFGAWDGLYLSNVRKLIEEDDYTAIMIEGDQAKYEELVENYQSNPKVKPVNAFVGFEQKTGLDIILEPLGVPKNFDLLSVDIDGNDYHVWNAVTEYRPKLVCIEFNPTIPNEIDFIQPADPKTQHGCSLKSLCDLAKEKNYELVSVLKCNAFFVDAQYYPLFGIENNDIHTMRRDYSSMTWLFCTYDGKVHLRGYQKLPWHDVDIRERDVQPIPSTFLGYPEDFSKIKSFFFRMYKSFRKRVFPK